MICCCSRIHTLSALRECVSEFACDMWFCADSVEKKYHCVIFWIRIINRLRVRVRISLDICCHGIPTFGTPHVQFTKNAKYTSCISDCARFHVENFWKEPRHFPFNKTITKSQMVTVRYPNLPLFLSQQIYLSMLFAASSINYIKLRLPSQIIKCKILAAWVQHKLSSMTIQMWCILFSYNLIRSLFCISLSSKERKEKTPTVFLRLLRLCKWNSYIV